MRRANVCTDIEGPQGRQEEGSGYALPPTRKRAAVTYRERRGGEGVLAELQLLLLRRV